MIVQELAKFENGRYVGDYGFNYDGEFPIFIISFRGERDQVLSEGTDGGVDWLAWEDMIP